ncbi:MAG: hypothetical protein ACR2GZ_07095 [Solirubrobacteraceae bacterium]
MPANPAGLIYGTISVAALLAAESARQETYLRTAGAVMITIVLYWLAHSYSQFIGERVEQQVAFTYRGVLATARHELTVVIGAAGPLVVLILFWVFGASLDTAVIAAIWTAAAIVIVLEIVIGVRAELTGRELVRQTVFGAILGLLVIALRVLLH